MIARCKPCQRAVIFTVTFLIDICTRRRVSTEFRILRRKMKCSRCRKAAYSFGFREGSPPPIPNGISLEVYAPAGIDPVEWVMARNDDERKRMVRRARG